MKKIGIIGGLGPMATVDLFRLIVEKTPAEKDQDNIPIIIYNNPQIPDRTSAILDGGESPVPAIISTGKALIQAGVDFLCIPCNTSFYFIEDLQAQLSVPLLNMIDLTVQQVLERGYTKVCVLGTRGTIESGIYKRKLEFQGIQVVNLKTEEIHQLTKVIYDIVKANDYTLSIEPFVTLLDRIKEKDRPEVFILGCTELPILFDHYKLDYPVLNPTAILAEAAVKEALE